MKAFFAVTAVLAFAAAGCAHSNPPPKHSHHASHHPRRHSGGTSDADSADDPSGPDTPEDAGATNRALGQSARDSLGHPAIGDY